MKYDKLKQVMQDRRISTRRLAIEAGIVPQSLYAALGGKVPFWPGWRQRVAEALGMDEAELFEEVTEHEADQNDSGSR